MTGCDRELDGPGGKGRGEAVMKSGILGPETRILGRKRIIGYICITRNHKRPFKRIQRLKKIKRSKDQKIQRYEVVLAFSSAPGGYLLSKPKPNPKPKPSG